MLKPGAGRHESARCSDTDRLAHVHRWVPDAEFEGVAVPGLHAEFFHRDLGNRVASVGCYRYAGRELLVAWGFVGEERCR